MHLRGKHKPSFTPHIDDATIYIHQRREGRPDGRKRDKKVYHHYTGYMAASKSDLPSRSWKGVFRSIVEKAVERMLPRGPLGASSSPIARLQGPRPPARRADARRFRLAKLNAKNSRSA